MAPPSTPKNSKPLSQILKKKALKSKIENATPKKINENDEVEKRLRQSELKLREKELQYNQQIEKSKNTLLNSNDDQSNNLVDFDQKAFLDETRKKSEISTYAGGSMKNIKAYFNDMAERNIEKSIDVINTQSLNTELIAPKTREIYAEINARSGLPLAEISKPTQPEFYEALEHSHVNALPSYYKLSKDAKIRADQQNYLNELREETLKKRNK